MYSEYKDEIEKLSKQYIKVQQTKIRMRTNSVFRYLLIFEWVFGIVVALLVSPYTWSGATSEVHIHIWSSILLGAVILLPPVILVTTSASSKLAPYLIACSQMLFGALLIHLMAGRIEAHFHIFGSLAFLATYRNWKVLLPATLVVVIDHIVRGIYWPQSIYGVLTGAEWRWLEHGAWVVFEDIFLVISIIQGRRDVYDIAKKRAELEVRNFHVEKLMNNLKEKQVQLVQSAKLASLGEMISGVAHELNNPLHFINGFNNRIKKVISKTDQVDVEKINSYSQIISDNCDRMRRIINHFREFSRVADNKLEPISVSEVVDRSLILLNEQLRQHNIVVEKNFADQACEILGDSNRLEQVLINLIANSRDALNGERSNKKITIHTFEKENYFHIEVTDNGPGIPPELQKKIFNPFFTTKEVGKGTGLGLSISHSIIDEHNGQIECHSDHSYGTTFVIKLPLQCKAPKKAIS